MGGRRPAEYDDERRRVHVKRAPLSADELATAAALRSYCAAARFRRNVGRALRPLQITFAQWRALEATWRLIRERGDAVGHYDVAGAMELDEASVSRLMHVLGRQGLLSHGPDQWEYAWRVFLTDDGERVVRDGYGIVASVWLLELEHAA
jgi:DNA-binding MarR family transcriptional regulator